MNKKIVTKCESYGPCACSGEVLLYIGEQTALISKETAETLGYEYGDSIEIVIRKSRKNMGKVKK